MNINNILINIMNHLFKFGNRNNLAKLWLSLAMFTFYPLQSVDRFLDAQSNPFNDRAVNLLHQRISFSPPSSSPSPLSSASPTPLSTSWPTQIEMDKNRNRAHVWEWIDRIFNERKNKSTITTANNNINRNNDTKPPSSTLVRLSAAAAFDPQTAARSHLRSAPQQKELQHKSFNRSSIWFKPLRKIVGIEKEDVAEAEEEKEKEVSKEIEKITEPKNEIHLSNKQQQQQNKIKSPRDTTEDNSSPLDVDYADNVDDDDSEKKEEAKMRSKNKFNQSKKEELEVEEEEEEKIDFSTKVAPKKWTILKPINDEDGENDSKIHRNNTNNNNNNNNNKPKNQIFDNTRPTPSPPSTSLSALLLNFSSERTKKNSTSTLASGGNPGEFAAPNRKRSATSSVLNLPPIARDWSFVCPAASGTGKHGAGAPDSVVQYYADTANDCRVYYVCSSGDDRRTERQRFVCPVGTRFDQSKAICSWWDSVTCDEQ